MQKPLDVRSWISLLAVAVAYFAAPGTRADDSDPASTPAVHERPEIQLNRWQEDWSVLADPELRTEPLDNLKYIPLSSSDPNSYASLGLDLRERVESTQIDPFGIGSPHANTYLIQRLDIYADVHPNANWQVFVQLQDDRAFSKDIITPVDKDPLDLEQAFVTYSNDVAGGTLKVRVGRQQMGIRSTEVHRGSRWSERAPIVRCGLGGLGKVLMAVHRILEPPSTGPPRQTLR